MKAKKFAVVFGLAAVMLLTVFASLEVVSVAAAEPPVCVMGMTQVFNHLTFTVGWGGGNPQGGEYPFGFGDGASDVLTGSYGVKVLPHDYSYQVGGVVTYTAGFTVVGPGGQAVCTEKAVIDDRPEPTPTPTPTPTPWPPDCSIKISEQAKNHVDFWVTWSGWSGGAYPFEFGDESPPHVLVGEGGEASLPHDYPYEAGELVVYTPTLVMISEPRHQGTVCTTTVVIDDRPEPLPPPTCTISAVPGPGRVNHIDFDVAWFGGWPSPFVFGDGGPPFGLPYEDRGQVWFDHDYPYDVGGVVSYTTWFTLGWLGGSTKVCTHLITIDDRPPEPIAQVYLPLIASNPAPPVIQGLVVQVDNHVTLRVIWQGGFAQWHRLQWGDGAFVDLEGAGGDRTVDHYYAKGAWTITFTVVGPGGTTIWRYDVVSP